MAHLKKAGSGHLLKEAGGHLVKGCWVEGDGCVGCDPKLPNTIYVTFAGLGGDFAPYNGKQTLTFDGWMHPIGGDCWWHSNPPGGPIGHVHLYWSGANWYAAIRPTTPPQDICRKQWRRLNNACNPWGFSPEHVCFWGAGCGGNPNSCVLSVGATCLVSWH